MSRRHLKARGLPLFGRRGRRPRGFPLGATRLPLRPVARLAQDEESGCASREARSGRGLGHEAEVRELHGFWGLIDLALIEVILAGVLAAAIVLALVIWFKR
jgi:hypothetical protein